MQGELFDRKLQERYAPQDQQGQRSWNIKTRHYEADKELY